MEHNKPNWDKLQAISVLTSDSPQLIRTSTEEEPIYIIYILYVQFNILLHPLLLYSAKLQHSEGFDTFTVLHLVHALF